MGLIAQPFRHPDSGIYYLRRRVPDDLRVDLGKTEIRRSLNTRDPQVAKAAFLTAYAESEQLFRTARNALDGISAPPVGTETRTIDHTPITLSELLKRYVSSLPMSGKPKHVITRHSVDYSRAVNRLIAKIGNPSITAVTPENIHSFAAELINPPTGTGPLAASSAKLLLARISSVLSFAVDSGWLVQNPVSTSRINKRLGTSKPKRSLDDDRGYNWNELITMFSCEQFKRCRHVAGRPGNAVYWIPLLTAYTGLRREEAAQLYVDDIRQTADGHWYFRIIDDKPDKSVKNDSSRRNVPIHSDLVELGLLELLKCTHTGQRLFPQLKKVSDGFAGIVSKAWRPITQQCGVYRPGRHPLHAFRHTFKTIAREVGIPKEVSDWITGHASNNVGDDYGINPLSRMATEMTKFPSIATAAGLLPRKQ